MNMRNNKYEIEDANHVGEVIVSWIITHACQECCGYCISPCKQKEITSEAEHFAIQEKLIQGGLTKNRYIGGEPLLIPHIPKLIQNAYERGLDTRLSTNGILLTETKFNEMKNFLNSVAFPFESTNNELNAKVRGINSKKHREIIEERIKMVKAAKNIGILVNTCVHKENLEHLEALGYVLNELKINHWKLRRFNSASGRGAVPNKYRFEITDEEFLEKVSKLQKLYPNLKIDGRMPAKLNTRLMVSPQGDLYRMVGAEYIYYGNMLKNNINIREIYLKDNCN